MASIIRIKRSSVSGNPTTLGAGELAYSNLTDNGSNGGDRLYIGMGTETSGNAANHVVIGGKYFTDKLDHSPGVLTSGSAIVVDDNKKIDDLLIDNLQLNGNTISTTNTNGDLLISPNGAGKTIIGNIYTDATTSLAEYIQDIGGGQIVDSAEIDSTYDDVTGTTALVLKNTTVTAGTYGSSTAIPVFTVDTKGRLTSASTASVATNINISGDTGTDAVAILSDTLAFVGGTGLTSTVTNNTVTFDIDSTVATLSGTQTLTNKSINLSNNTLTATSAQIAAAVSDETGSGSLVFGTSPTIATPDINGGTVDSLTSLSVRDTSAAYDLTIAATSSPGLSVGRTLTLNVENASRSITLGGNIDIGGNLTTAGAFTTSGAFAITLTATAATNLTLPTTGTLATVAGTETLTNKTLSTGSTWNGNTVAVAYGGTGTTNGSITGTGALTFTAGGSNTNINLVPQGTGTVDVGSKRITSLADPTQAQDAATKAYVDAVKTGLDVKESVRAATTATLTATYSGVGKTLTNSGTLAALAIDDVTLSVNDRVLVKDQSTSSSNGIYTVTTVGSGSVAWVMTRATDFDNTPGTEITSGLFTFVEEGTTNSDSGWVLTTNGTITLDTTGLTFAQFSGAGQVTAGAGLTKTGNTLDVIGTANRIAVTADAVDISVMYAGQTSITTLGTVGTGTWQGTIVAGQYGGTGVNNNGKTITLGGNLTTSGAYALTLTLTAATTVTLPATGTLATLAGTESLSNKTITSSSFSGTTISGSGLATFTNTTDASALGTAAVVLSGGLSVAKAMYIGTNITGSGAATSTLDGFNVDGGSY